MDLDLQGRRGMPHIAPALCCDTCRTSEFHNIENKRLSLLSSEPSIRSWSSCIVHLLLETDLSPAQQTEPVPRLVPDRATRRSLPSCPNPEVGLARATREAAGCPERDSEGHTAEALQDNNSQGLYKGLSDRLAASRMSPRISRDRCMRTHKN